MSLNPKSRRGFAHHLALTCKHCGEVQASTMTSKKLTGDKHYEVNRKVVLSFLEVGLGYSGVNTFCVVIGMAGVTASTHAVHATAIHNWKQIRKPQLMDEAERKIRSVHNCPSGVLDLAVSFDGSWQKRGHTSKHGLYCCYRSHNGSGDRLSCYGNLL
ncbi:hypothetical protein RRG08_049964 [Elysia crispata]|uniref:Mutator-like transposase domain-containing protein n=1 Tax=Elysia crispata TaxID=231223 RepID=A0AAE1B3W2_9GAST|nr:hypothetical protein RRG08_049964 [Elysia crispata]